MLKLNEQQIEFKLDDIYLAKGDRHLTYRVIENLLSNAMKFSPGDSSIKVSGQQRDGMIQVNITDQGPGIPKEEQSYIFNQYWSVQQAESQNMSISAGLGLAFCKMAIEQQNGTIGVDSNPAESPGSTFWFTLPQDEQLNNS